MKKFNYEKCMADVKEGIQEALQKEDAVTFIIMCAFKELLEGYCENIDDNGDDLK